MLIERATSLPHTCNMAYSNIKVSCNDLRARACVFVHARDWYGALEKAIFIHQCTDAAACMKAR